MWLRWELLLLDQGFSLITAHSVEDIGLGVWLSTDTTGFLMMLSNTNTKSCAMGLGGSIASYRTVSAYEFPGDYKCHKLSTKH